jgi:hypothetical protein
MTAGQRLGRADEWIHVAAQHALLLHDHGFSLVAVRREDQRQPPVDGKQGESGAMAPKPKRNRHGRARVGQPAPRRLEDDLKRHQLARDVIPQLVEATEGFLDYFPQVARRRVPDRIVLLSDVASDVLAWTALGAPRDESRLPVRCFAASCLLDSDPHRISWQTLAMSGIGDEVRTYVRAFASEATELPSRPTDPLRQGGVVDSVIDEVRAFAERLRANQATSADGLRVGRQLLGSAIALDPVLARTGEVGNLTVAGAFGLLERTLLTDDLEGRLELAAIMEETARALPGLVEHAAAHLDDDDEDELEEEEATAAFNDEELAEDGEGEDGEDFGFSLDDALTVLDERLRVTEEASEAADVAFHVACGLLIQGVKVLFQLPATSGARVRAIAAGDALLTHAGRRPETTYEVVGDAALLDKAYSRAAALLEADLPEPAQAAEPVEVTLSELDGLLGAMQDVAEQDLVEEVAGALALIGGAAQTLRAGVALGHQDADTQRRMAAALGTLDPLALVDLPEVRATAAQALRELARSAHGAAATSAARR